MKLSFIEWIMFIQMKNDIEKSVIERQRQIFVGSSYDFLKDYKFIGNVIE